MNARRALFALALASACVGRATSTPTPPSLPSTSPPTPTSAPTTTACGGPKLRVHFYDVGQGLAALVDLPDGRHVLVDAGDSPARPKCESVCADAHARLVASLKRDLGAAPIDLLWITHPHSDHMGGVPEILDAFKVSAIAENGHDPEKLEMKRLHVAARKHDARVHVVDAGTTSTPLRDTPEVHLRAVTPPQWSRTCKDDANACSIALRVDYCASSVLFTGDAEHTEEKHLDSGPATLLQVGHHGSHTSSSPAFLARVAPKYAVISSGKPDEGLNKGYCHPRSSAVESLSRALGGDRTKTVRAFADARCVSPSDGGWVDAPASDRLWSTARDGDVVLATTGDGVFARE